MPGCRVAGLPGCRVAGLPGCRVPPGDFLAATAKPVTAPESVMAQASWLAA